MKNNLDNHDFRRQTATDAESIQRQNAQILALQRYEKLVIGYKAASELTGIPKRQLQLMVAHRAIRVIRLSGRCVAFFPSQLFEDIEDLVVEKIWRYSPQNKPRRAAQRSVRM